MKIFVRIGCVLLVVGILLASVGWLLGAQSSLLSLNASSELSQEYKDITSLDLHLQTASVEIKQGDTFRITANNYANQSIKSTVETDPKSGEKRWSISQDRGSFFKQVGIHITPEASEVIIELPENFTADQLDLNLDAGNLKAETLNAKHVNLSIGAGALAIDKLIANGSNIKCGAGEIEIGGSLTGKNMIKCGMGRINLNLAGNIDDYNYSSQVGIGHIFINGENWEGFGNKVKKEPGNTANRFDLECGMGEISLNINSERMIKNGSEKTL